MPDKEVAVLESRLFQRRVLPWTQLLGYVRPPGHLRHRQAMAAWLAQLGLAANPEHLVADRRRAARHGHGDRGGHQARATRC